jgi:hypothetical protein
VVSNICQEGQLKRVNNDNQRGRTNQWFKTLPRTLPRAGAQHLATLGAINKLQLHAMPLLCHQRTPAGLLFSQQPAISNNSGQGKSAKAGRQTAQCRTARTVEPNASSGHPAAMPCGNLNSSAKACTGINVSDPATQLCTRGGCNAVAASEGLLLQPRWQEKNATEANRIAHTTTNTCQSMTRDARTCLPHGTRAASQKGVVL